MNTANIINQALKDIGKEDPNSFFLAQGVSDPTAVFGTLTGLAEVVDKNRLIEMPVAENAAIGVAIGAAMSGMRPVVSVHRVEFLLLALEQLFNNAAKANFISGGSSSVPLLIRAIIGRGWGQGPSHSQGFESVFASVPGLKVVCPSMPSQAYNLIKKSYLDDAPVVCLEHRWVHYAEGAIGGEVYSIEPVKLRFGDKLTLVSFGYLSLESLLVVDEYKKLGIEIELIDLQMIRPLKLDIVFESIKKTGHLMVVDQGPKFLGIGAEIVSQVVENMMDYLEKPPVRLGLPSLPSPSSRWLVGEYYCTSVDIALKVGEILQLKEISADAIAAVERIRNENPVDVPNQYFKGPF